MGRRVAARAGAPAAAARDRLGRTEDRRPAGVAAARDGDSSERGDHGLRGQPAGPLRRDDRPGCDPLGGLPLQLPREPDQERDDVLRPPLPPARGGDARGDRGRGADPDLDESFLDELTDGEHARADREPQRARWTRTFAEYIRLTTGLAIGAGAVVVLAGTCVHFVTAGIRDHVFPGTPVLPWYAVILCGAAVGLAAGVLAAGLLRPRRLPSDPRVAGTDKGGGRPWPGTRADDHHHADVADPPLTRP